MQGAKIGPEARPARDATRGRRSRAQFPPLGVAARSSSGSMAGSHFSSQTAAQRFDAANRPGDPHRQDDDRDGRACESLP